MVESRAENAAEGGTPMYIAVCDDQLEELTVLTGLLDA